ncbi:hypothetical protein HPP92_002481 [Vanilla planifolia]|uniref:Uncharacterized protein n=1 Tax=Vanilla planifolia TaxID=51239 RepID=A0A835S007_VANPL|nr:hypothetical protein HPP92_002481 [Vanilla planifolia]
MERPYRSKAATKKSYLSQAATFSMPRPAISPGGRSEKSFSGPLVSIIPKDARHRKKSDVVTTSPKISCMGRIKHKKDPVAVAASASPRKEKVPARRKLFGFGACGFGFPCCRVRGNRKMERAAMETVEEKKKATRRPAAVAAVPVPGLGQMRRYASGRETLAGFDWRNDMAGMNGGYGDAEEEEYDEVLVPHSAPILVCGGEVVVEPKKEVNLWRRRSMPPPPPLRVEKK